MGAVVEHTGKRSCCVECRRAMNNAARKAKYTPERRREQYIKHKAKESASSSAYYFANKDRYRELARIRYASDPDQHREKNKKYKRQCIDAMNVTALKKKYGITFDDWFALYEAQGGLCAICDEPLHTDGAHVATDHSHIDGRVRGLICNPPNPCNTMIGGLAERRPEILERAAAYLRAHAKKMGAV